MTTMLRCAAVGLSVALCQLPQATQQQETVDQQYRQILEDLRAIRHLLELQVESRAPRRPQSIVLPLDPSVGVRMGKPDAPVTIVEFSDLECSFCRQFHEITFPRIKATLIDTGIAQFVSLDFPLPMHRHAMLAARAAHCAGAQGKFWEMRDAVISATDVSEKEIERLARQLGVDRRRFRDCVVDSGQDGPIDASRLIGVKAGITGTPSFIIGRTTPEGVKGTVLVGAVPYADVEEHVKDILTAPAR